MYGNFGMKIEIHLKRDQMHFVKIETFLSDFQTLCKPLWIIERLVFAVLPTLLVTSDKDELKKKAKKSYTSCGSIHEI